MKLISVKCPECNASIDISTNKKECFCSYCGNKIILDDGSSTITHIYINKTKEKEIELEHEKLLNERQKDAERHRKKVVSFISVCIAVVLICIALYILKDNFNITFNFCIMLICCLFSFFINSRKLLVLKVLVLGLLLSVASIVFIIFRNDFNNTFTFTIAISLISYFVFKSIKREI